MAKDVVKRLEYLLKKDGVTNHLNVNNEFYKNLEKSAGEHIATKVYELINKGRAKQADIEETIGVHVAVIANRMHPELFSSISPYSVLRNHYQNEIEKVKNANSSGNAEETVNKVSAFNTIFTEADKQLYLHYQTEEGMLYQPMNFFKYLIDPKNRNKDKGENILYIIASVAPNATKEIFEALYKLHSDKLFDSNTLKSVNRTIDEYKNKIEFLIEALIEKDFIIENKDKEIIELKAKSNQEKSKRHIEQESDTKISCKRSKLDPENFSRKNQTEVRNSHYRN